MFSKDHKLLSIQSILLWSTAWNQPNNPKKWINTTPAWFYMIWNKDISNADDKKDFKEIYGSHYIILIPLNGQIVDNNWTHTLWIHALYKNEYKKRLKWIKSNKTWDHRISSGCPNVYLNTFWELYNHLDIKSIIYITDEPD
jgi:hypothetical protein